MKKRLFTLFLTITMGLCANAAAYNAENQVSTVGKQILTKNSLPAETTFTVTDTEKSSEYVDNNLVVYVPKTSLKAAGNDNEVAAVIAHELGIIINGSVSKKQVLSSVASSITGSSDTAVMLNQLSMNKISSKEEMSADITGVDLMIQAGYNPLAMIVVLTKMDASTVELLTGQIANGKRAMYVYNYLSYNYPSKVSAGYNCQEYKNFLEYAKPTIDERNSSEKKLAKFNKEQAKLKKERSSQIAKYKSTGGLTGWDASYTILKNLSESSEVK